MWYVRDTDLKHNDEGESYGKEVKVLWKELTIFIPETTIPSQDKNDKK